MAIEEYAPRTRPTTMAKAKLRSVSPPKMYTASTGTTLVSAVLIERTMTWFSDQLVIWRAVRCTPSFSVRMFSLTRLNTTTVS